MNRDRFIDIINAYGGKAENWPADEALQMDALLQEKEYQVLRQSVSALDEQLDTYAPRQMSNVTPLIMARIRITWLDRIVNLLMPQQYGAFAASLVLAAGILIGVLNPVQSNDSTIWDDDILTLSLEDVTQYE